MDHKNLRFVNDRNVNLYRFFLSNDAIFNKIEHDNETIEIDK